MRDADLHEILHGFHRAFEVEPLMRVEIDLDHPLHALGADHRRHADIEALYAVFAGQVGGAGQHALLVLEIGLGHRDRRRGRRIVGGAGLQKLHHLGAAVARALDDFVQALMRDPAHLDEVGQRNAGHGRVAGQRHHGVAMAAQHEGGHVLDGHVEFAARK